AKTYRKYAGENNRAEEALKRQSEDIQGEVDTTIFRQSLAKVNGDANKLNAYYQDLAKRVLGDALGKSGDLAATNSAEQLFELIKSQNGIDFLKGINDGDGKAVSKAKDLSKITGGLGALTRQLHSSNPIEQAAAQNIISKLADETGLAPDEIIGMDFRTFKKGEVIARPDTPLAYMGPKPTKTDTPQTNMPLARKALQDSYHAGQEASISDMVRLEMGKRVENEGIISQNAANSLVEAIQKLVSEQGMTNEQAINLLQQEIQSANGLMEKGYRAQALSTFRKYGLPVSEFSGRPEEAKQVADQAKIFIEQAAANPRNLAAVKASYQTIVQNNKFDEETALLIKRETKMKIDARTVGAIRSGSATPELSERDRAFVSSAISRIGAPTAVNPEPEQTTPAQTRNEQYRQRDEAREQYPPETRPPTPGGGMPEI
ncbi:MAG: hypothetical protein PHW50_02750, partial [Patescibacteria group bacterium]|nr:hypothetical protein [Patescibacteria group bacterium]